MKTEPPPPLKERVEAVLQRIAKDDPLLRKALDRRCALKADCERGPFGCDRCDTSPNPERPL